jgi:phosphohistidine phosphatase
MRSLLLLRHATTEHLRPGKPDPARRLTPHGEREAAAVGDHLRATAVRLDLVLCSPAVRARQTLDALRVTAPVVVSDLLYGAGGDEIVDLVRGMPDEVEHLLVVGHAPGLPAVVLDLADPGASDAEALATLERRFPAATLATLAVDAAWPALRSAALVSARLP